MALQAAKEGLAALQQRQQEVAAAAAEAQARCAALQEALAEAESSNLRLQASRLQVPHDYILTVDVRNIKAAYIFFESVRNLEAVRRRWRKLRPPMGGCRPAGGR